MSSPTSDAVKDVLKKDYDVKRKPSIAPYQMVADRIVDRLAAYGDEKGAPITDAEDTSLRTMLAAWAYALSDKPLTSTSANGASGAFAGQTGFNFQANLYGQAAMMMDPTGYLAIMQAGGFIEAGAYWQGTAGSARIPWRERHP